MDEENKTCFVISPIGPEGSEIRDRADQIFRHVIVPSVEAFGFVALRADQISEPGLITTQVIQHIVEDPLVVADLTGANPNVFYELAIRHVIRKPLVQIIQRGEKIPFDVAPMRVVQVDHTNLDIAAKARDEIKRHIESMVSEDVEDIESPISIAVDLRALSRSDDPERRSLAEVMSLLADLRLSVLSIESRLSVEGIGESILRSERRSPAPLTRAQMAFLRESIRKNPVLLRESGFEGEEEVHRFLNDIFRGEQDVVREVYVAAFGFPRLETVVSKGADE